MRSIKAKLLKLYGGVFLLLLPITTLFFSTPVVYSTLIAFVSSALVMLGSLSAYERMVQTKLSLGIDTFTEQSYDNPYELFDEDDEEGEVKDIKEVIKEEKQNAKANKRGIKGTFGDIKVALSFYRLGSYLLLVIGFLYLNSQALLHIPSYLLFLALAPILLVALVLNSQEDTLK